MKILQVADLFCGAGGTSAGALEAIERLGFHGKLTAINHWPVAVATHTANHPEARHLCTAIDDVNPLSLYAEGELDLLWASPECTHHSVARGGKPINDQSRATAWCVIRWAQALMPKIILVENVPEFRTWGGIGHDGRPLKSKRGKTFRAWKAALESLGYRVDDRVLCAADYGDPTTRERLFVQAVRGRRRIVWPEPTHARGGIEDLLGTRKPWVAAREIIDWTMPGQSIYERKKPLSEKTMRRIMAGLQKFGLRPFIVPGKNENPRDKFMRGHSLDAPLPTVTASGHLDLVEPFILPNEGIYRGNRARGIDEPLNTITAARGAGALVSPFLVTVANAGHDEFRARSIDEPCPTVTAGASRVAVAEPYLVQVNHAGENGRARELTEPLPTVCGNRGEWSLIEPALLPQQSEGALRSINEPTPTVATAGAIALVEPFLVSYYGTGGARSVAEPMDTVTTKDRFGLARPVVTLHGKRYLLDIRFRMLQPHELAAAQGFRREYRFTGNKTEQVKQIGNAVPRRLARAIVTAALSQNSDVSAISTQRSAA